MHFWPYVFLIFDQWRHFWPCLIANLAMWILCLIYHTQNLLLWMDIFIKPSFFHQDHFFHHLWHHYFMFIILMQSCHQSLNVVNSRTPHHQVHLEVNMIQQILSLKRIVQPVSDPKYMPLVGDEAEMSIKTIFGPFN